MGDGCLLKDFLGGDRDLFGRCLTGVDMGSFDGDGFLGPSCRGWWHRGPEDGWSKVNCSMTVHREDSRRRESAVVFLISGRDVWFLTQPHESFLCTPGNDRPGGESVAWGNNWWDCRLPFRFPRTLPACSSSWVSKDVIGLGIEGPVCFRGPLRAECGRTGSRVVVAVRDEVLVEAGGAAADFALVCARVVTPVFDVVVPPGPTFRVSGACVVLFERDSSVARPPVSLVSPQSLPVSIAFVRHTW